MKGGERKDFINNIFSQFVSGDVTGLLITMVSKDRQKRLMIPPGIFEESSRIQENEDCLSKHSKSHSLMTRKKAALPWKLLGNYRISAFDFQFTIPVDESLIGGMV